VQIQAIFEETAGQEKEHAKRLFKFLEGGEAEVCAVFPAGVIGTTEENLEEAAAGEPRDEDSEPESDWQWDDDDDHPVVTKDLLKRIVA